MDKLLHFKYPANVNQFPMIEFRIISLFLVCIFLISSCGQPATPTRKPATPTHEPTAPVKVTFSGKILTKAGDPIGQAQVEVNGVSTQTDGNGAFKITVQADDQNVNNRFVMNIWKKGFGLVSRVYYNGIQDRSWVLTEATVTDIDPTLDNLITDGRKSNICLGSLSSRVNWSNYNYSQLPIHVENKDVYLADESQELKDAVIFAQNRICNDGISLSIPANSLVAGEGNPPSRKVSVSLSTIDIYEPDSMPGDYTVYIDNTSSGYMVTYGAGTIIISSGNKTYNLKQGATATLQIPVNSAQLKNTLPDTVPLLQYDEKQGVWKAIGEAKRNVSIGLRQLVSEFTEAAPPCRPLVGAD